MRVIPFEFEHTNLIDFREDEKFELEKDPVSAEKLKALARFGTGGTMIHDGRILGFFGYFEVGINVYEVWAFPSVYVPLYPRIWLKTVKQYIIMVEETHNPQRLQTVSYDDELHRRWMKFLGFTLETPQPMRKYFVDGRDALMWSKVY